LYIPVKPSDGEEVIGVQIFCFFSIDEANADAEGNLSD
jgi:hypothetical protein